jgi:hypothetical protein
MAGTNKLGKSLNLFMGEQSSLFIPAISDKEKSFTCLTPSVKVKKAFFFVTDIRNK